MNNEPVAWWDGKDLFFKEKHFDQLTPLYTHPVKQLSDEEIEQIAEKYLTAHAQFIGAGEVIYDGEIEFARAIIKEMNK